MRNETKGIAPLIIAVVVVVVVAVAGVGAYVLVSRGGGTGGGGGGGGGDIGSATSLKFDVSSTTGGVSSSMTFYVKGIGSDAVKMRVEGTAAGQEFKLIINGEQEKVWMYIAGQWMDFSSSYSDYWEQWNSAFSGYKESLSGWAGSGTWTSPDGTVTISNIQVNPTLEDSLFVV
jgi:hypothetical protein